jgi:uncharacterized protein (TIGR03083 family)
MTLGLQTSLDEIIEHCEQTAFSALGALDKPVTHCPGWNVRELLDHLIGVHWFWATIVEQQLLEPPESGEPAPVPESEVIVRFLDGARHLVHVLKNAPQDAQVWTWAPTQLDVAFITRHQIQEIAVHHWDVANASGRPFALSPAVACDAIDEFLTFSVSSESYPAPADRPLIDGALGLQCTDVNEGWTVRDGSVPRTIAFSHGVDEGVPTLSGTSTELLLWLFGRVELAASSVPAELARRLRANCNTD